jgi:hypothetical protein
MTDDIRLARVERKIDELQVTVVNLARVEERLLTVFNRQTKIQQKIDGMEKTLATLLAKSDNRFGERVFWIVVAVISASIARYVF